MPTTFVIDGVRCVRSKKKTGPEWVPVKIRKEPRVPGGARPGNWPMESDAVGVLPKQRKAAYEESVALGVPTYFNERGAAVFESPSHRKRYCRAGGWHDNNGGYGDP